MEGRRIIKQVNEMKKKLMPVVVLLFGMAVVAILMTGLSKKETANPGDEIIPFELKDLDGNTHKSSDFKGKKLVINFFATWCDPCIEEAPELEAFHKDYDDAMIIIIAKGESKKRMEKYVSENNSEILYLLDTNEKTSKQYSVIGQPDTLIVDENGVIFERFVGPTTKARLIELIESM